MNRKAQLPPLLLTLAGLFALVQPLQAQCRKVSDQEFAHGANEFVQLQDRTMKRIRGQVFLPNLALKDGKEQAKDVIVELYDYPVTSTGIEIHQVPNAKPRLTACLTGNNGKFSFKGLKPGRYLLRAGTRERNQFNHIHIVITLDPKSEETSKENLEIILTPGT